MNIDEMDPQSRKVLDIAVRNKERLSRNYNNTDIRETIVDIAIGHGHYQIWITVFKDDPDMLKRFKEA